MLRSLNYSLVVKAHLQNIILMARGQAEFCVRSCDHLLGSTYQQDKKPRAPKALFSTSPPGPACAAVKKAEFEHRVVHGTSAVGEVNFRN